MISKWLLAMVMMASLALATGEAAAADRPAMPMPPETPELLDKGKLIYFKRCSFCHGLLGDGEGPASPYMDPRPRDFTLGTFKFRTTQSGELPTNEDLFRTVSRGLSGTGMQAFDSDVIKNGLSEDERWAVIAYVKTFAPEFNDPSLDPVKTGKVVALPKDKVSLDAESIAKGKEIFEKTKCWECHGKLGRGDGQKAFDRKDDWGFPIRIRNVTLPWKIKAGNEVEDIFMRFSTGINGTPMPSFAKTLNETDRWYLANFIKSLQHKEADSQVLLVRKVEGDVPDAPDDSRWAAAEATDVRLTGQVVAAPRWQNPGIEMATVRAVYNDKEIAFLIEWSDPFKDVIHASDKEIDVKDIRAPGAFNSYVRANGMVPRQLATFRDAVALQFPVKPPESAKKPHFVRGDSSSAVHLWVWKSDVDAAGGHAVEEANSRGWSQPPKVQAEEQQQVVSRAVWDQGRWSMVMKRPLNTGDKNDVQFEPGRFIPMAVNAWDGSNGEHGMIMSLSTWRYVLLEAPASASVYIYALFAVMLTAAGLYLLVRWVEARSAVSSTISNKEGV
ncbi:MAG: hypothetical protein A3G18_03555 [Rhodospirillales bacterium RIFCSPLOWO2_12_FULL_58_28]|nr:MAG: hypothetical protein A3H92_01065 [Rhodospirillales bacterium RIFCSPLOWO2_02_FULL_58_16]OHC76841.1 MAG: hypothetical protein A3G18_03555 [Rhodospirillales bacterium RIFCSPLOWO2_12_FULL_58_28]